MRLAAAVASLSLSVLARAQVPDAVHERTLEVIARITELQGERELDADARAELEGLRAELRRRFDAASPTSQHPREPAPPASPPRPLSAGERALRDRALAATRHAVFETDAGAWLRRLGTEVTLPELTRLDHPSLAALPAWRFYVARLDCELPRPDGAARLRRIAHVLVVFDADAGSVTIPVSWTPTQPDVALFASGRVRAPDDATLAQLHTATALLRHASGGRCVLVEGDADEASPAHVDRHFCLGPWAAKLPVPPHLVVAGGDERRLLTWDLHAWDFDVPLTQRFAWQRFDAATGAWLGRATADGDATFPPDTAANDRAPVAAARTFADTRLGR